MTLVLFILCLLLIPMAAVAQMDHSHSPMSAEDCANLSLELRAVVTAMNRPGSRIDALPKPESGEAVEPGIHKLEVALRPLSEVALWGQETKPKQSRENRFGGFVRLTVPKDGAYRISTDSTIWIEVVEGETPIERVKTAPRLHCERIHKSLTFPLRREGSYWIELSGSTRSDVPLLITGE